MTVSRVRLAALSLAALAAATALVFVAVTPFVSRARIENNGSVRDLGTSINGLSLTFVVIQLVAVVAAVAALVAALRGDDGVAGGALKVAAVAGLVPAIVPGVLAFCALRLLPGGTRSA